MKVFDLFKKMTTPDTLSANKSSSFDMPFPYSNKLSDAEINFMIYSNGHDTDISTFSQKYKYEYNLNYNQEINKLIKLGYLSIGTAEASLTLYTLKDLKAFLKSNGESTSGKKDELIARIIDRTSSYENYFPKRIFCITDKGSEVVQQYELRRIEETKSKVKEIVSCIRNHQYERMIQICEIPADPNNPLSIGYTKYGIEQDIDTITEYASLGHYTDRDLSLMVVALIPNTTFKGGIYTLKCLGYDDVTAEELSITRCSLLNLRGIVDYRAAGIKKYKISSCKDERVCEKCQKMEGKEFMVANAELGKNLPPFCPNCRCITTAVFNK